MRRWQLTVLLLIAAFLVVEPIVHTHPLARPLHDKFGTAPLCAACATAAEQAGPIAPAISSPAASVALIAVARRNVASREETLPLASRAPPAAA